jgi:hypothetical protein
MADALLHAASNGKCLPDWNERICKHVTTQFPRGAWRLVNRWDSHKTILLFYRLESPEPAWRRGCIIADVALERTGKTWRVRNFGFTPGPCHLCPG